MDLGGDGQAASRSLRGSAARLGASLLGLVRTRLELASIEFAEERNRIQQQLALLIAAAGLLMFAVLFAAVWVVVYFWDTNRLTAIAVVALVFAWPRARAGRSSGSHRLTRPDLLVPVQPLGGGGLAEPEAAVADPSVE